MLLHSIPKEGFDTMLSERMKLMAMAFTGPGYGVLQLRIGERGKPVFFHASYFPTTDNRIDWQPFPFANIEGWAKEARIKGLTVEHFDFKKHVIGGLYRAPA